VAQYTPPRTQVLERTRGTPTWPGGGPTRRWPRTRQQCPARPTMSGETSGHGGRHGPARAAPPRMWGANGRDRAEQLPPRRPRHCPARQRPTPPGQHRETLAARRLEPFTVGGVADPVPWRATPERFDAPGRALNEATLHGDHGPWRVAFHDLGDEDMPPWPPPGTPLGSPPLRLATRLATPPDRGAPPLGTAHAWTRPRAPTPPLDEPTHQRQVTGGGSRRQRAPGES
jgi:hypothetical protein